MGKSSCATGVGSWLPVQGPASFAAAVSVKFDLRPKAEFQLSFTSVYFSIEFSWGNCGL